MATNPETAPEIIGNALAFFVNDTLPTDADREWAETKMHELAEGPFDVLFGRREDGSFALDPDFVGGVLLAIQADLRHFPELERKSARLERIRKNYGLMSHTSRDVLDGKLGEGAQLAFLHGAIKMVEAELLQRGITHDTFGKPAGEL